MNEREFLLTLQKRAREQENELDRVPFPGIFSFVVSWLSFHPWRFLIPLAFILSLLLRLVLGNSFTNEVLFIFSKI